MKTGKWSAFFLCVLVCVMLPAYPAVTQSAVSRELSEKMDAAVSRTMDAGHIPSCAAALVRGGKIVWVDAYGYSNVWAKTKAVPETVYLIGSTFKAMSMTALLQQMEKGKFKLDDPVSDHLKEFRIQGEDLEKKVTFRHMLTHISGMPGDFGPYLVWGDTAPLPLEEYLAKYLRVTNLPLTKVEYSNMAYSLIAYLVEQFSGVPYKEYMQKNIFDVIEMTDLTFTPQGNIEERLAIPYQYSEESGEFTPAVRLKANVWPAGIIYGTIYTQANWLITNLNHGVFKGKRLISEETFQETMKRQYDQFTGPISAGWLNETTGYGLTWWISERNGEKLFAHSGSLPGYTAFIVGNLDKGEGFVILTNGNRAHKFLFDLAVEALDILDATVN